MIGASNGGYACAQGCFHVFLRVLPPSENAMSVAINKFDSIHEFPLLNGGEACLCLMLSKWPFVIGSPLVEGVLYSAKRFHRSDGLFIKRLLTEVMVPCRRDVRVARKAPQPNHRFCGALQGGFSR